MQERTENALEISSVVLLTTIGIFLRAWHLGRAARYDEAYTYLECASHRLLHVVSGYRAPNNHILHSLLVHFSTQLFGAGHVGLRLPAFVAGVLIIPAS
jgi:hypothetical protein